MEKKIDLHIHTNCSDGDNSIYEVIDMAINNKLDMISITDHDTVMAYSDEVFKYAYDRGIELVTGVEISVKYNNETIHVLGYNIDVENENLNNKLEMIRNQRHIYLRDVADKFMTLGYIVNVDSLDKIEAVTKAHIANDIINNKSNSKLLIDKFGYIPDKGEFIESMMNEGCPCFVKKKSISPVMAAEMIREAGGVVFLAHPVAYKYEDGLTDEDILRIVREMNADGIEANYIYVDKFNNVIDDREHYQKLARDNGLKISTGSDFHKIDGIHPEIGFVNYEM